MTVNANTFSISLLLLGIRHSIWTGNRRKLMIWLDHLLRTGSELYRREVLLCPLWGLVRQTAFVMNGNSFCLTPAWVCDYKCLASSSSTAMATSMFPQVISVSCPRFLKTYIVSWEQLLMNVQDKPVRWDCLPSWDTLSAITGLRCLLREKGKRREGKYFVIIKIKVLNNMAWVELSWGRQASWKKKSDR